MQEAWPNNKSVPLQLSPESQTWLAVLDQMPIAVTVAEVPSGRLIWTNNKADAILGHTMFPASSPGEYLQYGGVHEDGRPYEAHEYPLARAVLDGEVVERELLHYRRGDGRLIVLEVSASRVRTLEGQQLAVLTYQDVTADHEARRALKEAAERVQLALNAGAILGTWVWNLPENVITADELFAHSFRLDPQRCRTGFRLEEVHGAVHPADRAGVEAAIAEALARGGAYRHRYRVLHQDGAYRWVEASGWVEMERGAPRRFPGVLLDISAWKQAEEARNLLMREVDHRARNALVMVQSVVRLTDASDPAHYRREVIGRVDAMARAQGSLSRSNWQGGVLEDVIREELSCCATPQRFTLTGPTITLPAEQVQPVNIIIHELATNAMKFGALSAPAGKVEVSWEASRQGEIVFTWREVGGPAVKQPERRGFGSRLIERLSAQLGGPMELDWQVSGLVARLRWRSS